MAQRCLCSLTEWKESVRVMIRSPVSLIPFVVGYSTNRVSSLCSRVARPVLRWCGEGEPAVLMDGE